jgi:hypothetical protein
MLLHDNSCSMSSISNLHNQSTFLEDSSVTSVLYIRAKSVYKIRKLFNQHRLKTVFDALMIKTYSLNFRTCLYNLEGRRLLKIHSILSRSIRKLNEKVFEAFTNNCRQRSSQLRSLNKIASKRGFRDLSFGLKQWQH